jgi:exopolysaccharide biosynthesis polyprenyl glycosylphosphotransferase
VALKTFPDDGRRLTKRAIDVAVSALALLLAAPLMALVALAVRLDSPGPALFSQERYGLHRHRFRVWKFRTMVADAEARQAALEGRNEAGGALFKIRDDPRMTRVGRWLRRTSLDELPQLWNVLRGEMSLVGPRPLPVRDVARFDEPWLMRRFSAPPGLTGLWQVHGRSESGFDDLVAMDLEYIDRWSLGLDLRILAATVPAVLRGHGAM